MSPTGDTRTNRRGRLSREEILDAASRVMAERGYAGSSMSTLSEAAGLPKSAIYHHFSSKAGLLSAVMERGAYAFFHAMREAQSDPPQGTSHERLGWFLQRTGEVFQAQPEFLRLHLLLLMSSEAAETQVGDVIARVRLDGRRHMNWMIRQAFAGEGPTVAQAVADELDYFGMAGFDGIFIATQAEPDISMKERLDQLTDAMAALGDAITTRMRPTTTPVGAPPAQRSDAIP